MRIRMLLIAISAMAAAFSAVPVVHAQAIATNYQVLVPASGFQIFANQLINGSDVNHTNNSVNTMISSGAVSDPEGKNNTTLYLWNGAGYAIYQYFTDADANAYFGSSSGNGFYDSVGNLASESLKQGSGSFLFNPTGTTTTITVAGIVPQGTFTLTIQAGFNMLSIVPPIAANPADTNSWANFPGTSDPNGLMNDVLYCWNGSGYNAYLYVKSEDLPFPLVGPDGFYDAVGNLFTGKVPVGQSFFILHYTLPVIWTTSYTVE